MKRFRFTRNFSRDAIKDIVDEGDISSDVLRDTPLKCDMCALSTEVDFFASVSVDSFAIHILFAWD